jgi:hypothetical protein
MSSGGPLNLARSVPVWDNYSIWGIRSVVHSSVSFGALSVTNLSQEGG